MRGFLFFCCCCCRLWVLEASLSRCSTQYLYETRRRQKLVSQLPVCVHYVCEGGGGGVRALLQQVVASDWCIGGWKQRTCSTVELSVSTAFMYLLRMAKISLLRIWYFLMRSAIFFSGCRGKKGEEAVESRKAERMQKSLLVPARASSPTTFLMISSLPSCLCTLRRW